MRFATYLHDGVEHAGVVAGEQVHPITGVTMTELIALGLPAALARGEAALADAAPLALSGVTLLAPLQPPTMRDFVAFEEHIEGVRQAMEGAAGVPDAWFGAPAFYFTNPHAVIGTGRDVPVPGGSERLDYELEVAVVVGAPGADLDPADASDHIFGYTILNDWSARDLQAREMQVGLGPAKGKDFANTLGPWIVTADELATFKDDDGFLDLRCTAEVNGVQIGDDVLSNMGWTFDSLLAYASRDATLVPGDVLGSGTVGHGGCLAELWGRQGAKAPPPLKVGDVVTLTVEGIGSISNRVVAGHLPRQLPPPRRRDQAAARAAASARGPVTPATSAVLNSVI